MDLTSFTYKGKEYQVDKVIDLDPEGDERCILVITTDSKKFKLTFKESIYKWVITELAD